MELLYKKVDGIERVSDGICTFERAERLTKDETYLYVTRRDLDYLRDCGSVWSALAHVCKIGDEMKHDLTYAEIVNVLTSERNEVQKSHLWVRVFYVVREISGRLYVMRGTLDDDRADEYVASFYDRAELQRWARERLIKLQFDDVSPETRRLGDFMLNLMRL